MTQEPRVQQENSEDVMRNMIKKAERSKARMVRHTGMVDLLYTLDDQFFHFSIHVDKPLRDKTKQPHGRMSTKWAPITGVSNVTGASQGVSPLPNLHNLQLIT